ncbi:MAG: PTS sugar transporter subunit IIA [Gammaproteobacteria bacterium]
MTVKVILITHERIGTALLDTAKITMNESLDHVSLAAINHDDDPDVIFRQLKRILDKLTKYGDDFLMLTDLIGSTPCNIAQRLLDTFSENKIAIVTGLNLPMLLKVLNYRDLPLHNLEEKAIEGGRQGIGSCQPHD